MTIGTLTGTDYKDPPKVIKKTYKATVAMRGREKGQCLEYHTDGITNTITTVQKDNMTVCMTTTTGVCKVMLDDYLYKDYGVFKLTERECLRLMGVRDSDIDKMKAVNSPTQCYKQAGNSIIVPVLMAIFSQLNIKGVTPWNELTQSEREELIEKNR